MQENIYYKYFYCILIILDLRHVLLMIHGVMYIVSLLSCSTTQHVKGDGFCFLFSVQEVLSKDHKISPELSYTRQVILDHLFQNTEKYLTFYTKISQDALITLSDLLLEEIIKFFDYGNFNINVVDLLVQICADALSLEIYLFQNNDGDIQVLQIPGWPFAKKSF